MKLCELLPWDTEFFGIRIARVAQTSLTELDLIEIDSWCQAHAIECLYFVTNATDWHTASLCHKAAFKLVDVQLRFRASSIRTHSIPASSVPVVSAEGKHRNRLMAIAEGSFLSTRFFVDPHFDDERCAALYRTWIEKSCDGFADATLIVPDADRVAGFVTCKLLERDQGSIELLGVADSARNRGIGSSLVGAALRWFKAEGCDEVSVRTQLRNISACRMYERSGFLLADVRYQYHKWYET